MLRRVRFTLFNKTMKFDKDGNPPARYNLVSWDWSSQQHTVIGSYEWEQGEYFSADARLIHWMNNGTVSVRTKCLSSTWELQRVFLCL